MLPLFPLSKTNFDVLEDGHLKRGKRVNTLYGHRVEDADVGINDPNPPEVESIVEGHDVGYHSSDEMIPIPLVLELAPDLFCSGPVTRLKSSCLGKELHYVRHGGFQRVAKLISISMRH